MTAAVTRGADALVRAQAARLDGFATRLDDLEPDDQLAAHDDALAVLTAALTDRDDPDALVKMVAVAWGREWDTLGEQAREWYRSNTEAFVAAILGGES
ncbi:hypothetical protein [Cellulosimicrobium funkei]|uniref:hypothetical protein n=1 Tax=Cellulosimicrobium funkei TaxID=264251 RepID=UPI0037DC8F03